MTEEQKLILECYKKHEKLICERAWKFASTPHHFEDLKSEGIVLMYHALKKWEPRFSKFSTFFHTVLTNHYIALIRKEKRLVFCDDNEMPVLESKQEKKTFDYEDICKLSKHVRNLYETIKKHPTLIFKGTEKNGRELKKSLRNYLESLDWSRHKIDMTFKEIKCFIKLTKGEKR